jgi:hypothetical protein
MNFKYQIQIISLFFWEKKTRSSNLVVFRIDSSNKMYIRFG